MKIDREDRKQCNVSQINTMTTEAEKKTTPVN